jgi:tripartite-type tricarboxylate transporter receptor subunit TctC
VRGLFCGLAFSSLLAVSAGALAQAFPSRPVKLVVPFAASGAVDAVARVVAPLIADSWGQPLLVENRVGAGGNIGAETVARAAADGYTYLLHTTAFAINVSLQKVSYHPVKDFAPVMLIGSTNAVMIVPPAFEAKSLGELVKLAKDQPGRLSYASSGNGSSGHLNMVLFLNLVGADIQHIPYKDISQAQNDLMAGRVQVWMAVLPPMVPLIKSGKMRGLGVSGASRSDLLPGIPTMQEAGVPGYEALTWYGLYAPAGAPRDAIARTHDEMEKALRRPDVRERFVGLGIDIVASTPEYLARYLQNEATKWAEVIRSAGVKLE